MTTRRMAAIGVLTLLVSLPLAFGEDDLTSLSYISYLERYATVRPGQGGETIDAVVNMPVLVGDRVDTGRGARVEVQLSDGSSLWIDEFTTVDFDSVANSRDADAARTALFLADGGIVIEIPASALGESSLRLEARAGTVFLNRPGLYRLESRRGELRVESRQGLAELPDGVGSVLLRGGEQAFVRDQTTEKRSSLAATDDDDFWGWVQARRRPAGTSRTAQYVDARAAGRAAVLDSYGDWVYVSGFSSWMWRPRVSVGWVPYSDGRWYWTSVGYSWISYEPWGWYPFHHGSWYFDDGYGWLWGWDSVWGPAWVHWMHTPGYVGWCPRGYYDWWYWQNNRNSRHGWNPGRWHEASFNFSGRVRIRDVDPRPWTFVAGDQFGASHIDRVRLDTSRVIRDLPDRDAFVRSGQLVTRTPARNLSEGTLDEVFREPPGTRQVRDLSSVFRRQVAVQPRNGTPANEFTPTRTRDIIAPVVRGDEPGMLLRDRRTGDREEQPSSDTRSRGERTTTESPRVRLPDGSDSRVGRGHEVDVPTRSIRSRDDSTSRRGGERTTEQPPSTSNRGGRPDSGGDTKAVPAAPRRDLGSPSSSGRQPARGDPPARSDPPRRDPPARNDSPARHDPPPPRSEPEHQRPTRDTASRAWTRDDRMRWAEAKGQDRSSLVNSEPATRRADRWAVDRSTRSINAPVERQWTPSREVRSNSGGFDRGSSDWQTRGEPATGRGSYVSRSTEANPRGGDTVTSTSRWNTSSAPRGVDTPRISPRSSGASESRSSGAVRSGPTGGSSPPASSSRRSGPHRRN